MGISMSESEEIRRLEISDHKYHHREIQKLGRSAPQQFRDHQNQQFPPPLEKSKSKHLLTEPPTTVKYISSSSVQKKTSKYNLEEDLEEFDIKKKQFSLGLQKSRRVKENINKNNELRVSKSNAEGDVSPPPQSMRSRKVKVSKK